MKIEYPSRKERRQAVRQIMDRGFPKRKPFYRWLHDLYRQVGLEFLFHGMGSAVAMMAVIYLCCFLFAEPDFAGTDPKTWYTAVILIPLAFQLPLLLSAISEKEQRVYELQMCCPVTACHILALRMILAGGVSLVLNGLLLAAIFLSEGMAVVFHLLCLSVTALLIYAFLYLLLVERGGRLTAQVLYYGVWWLAHSGMFRLSPGVYEFLALGLPVACHVAAWILLCFWGGRELRRWLDGRSERRHYAAI